MHKEISWYVPKIGNCTLFAHTNWLVHWYAGTVPDRTKCSRPRFFEMWTYYYHVLVKSHSVRREGAD